jgi:hypothetical protein
MGESPGDVLEALRVAYADLADLAASVSEREAWLPTGCAGWVVRDLLLHLLSDAQRGLVALATPASREPDRDAVTYWVDAPTGDDPQYRHVRGTRTIASAYGLRPLTTQYVETARAVVTLAGRADPRACVATQGHTLLVGDLVATLVVEAAVHHLDLVTDLDRPGPAALPLSVVRRTLDGLLGHPVPVAWDDATYALAGTGRRALDAAESSALGDDAARFPLLS